MRRLRHRIDEGLGRIEIVAVEADIELAPLDALDREPVDEFRRHRLRQGLQHGAPGGDLHLGAARDAAHHGVDAQARVGIEHVGIVIQPLGEALRQLAHRRLQALQVAIQRQRRGQHLLVDRARVDLLAVAHHVVGGARQHLLAQGVQEHLHRAVRPPVLQALQPAIAGQGARRLRDVAHQVHGAGIVEDQILDPAPQAARARGAAAAFAAEQPAAQIDRLLPGQVRGEGAVDRLEQVMAFVEHVAGRQALILRAQRRLDHHQRVVGDHDVGLARAAHRALDEAAAVMRAGAVDAFAAPVGEAADARGAEDVAAASPADRRRPGRRRASPWSSAPSGRRRRRPACAGRPGRTAPRD